MSYAINDTVTPHPRNCSRYMAIALGVTMEKKYDVLDLKEFPGTGMMGIVIETDSGKKKAVDPYYFKKVDSAAESEMRAKIMTHGFFMG